MKAARVLAALAAALIYLLGSGGLFAGEVEDKAYQDMLREALLHPGDVDYLDFRNVYAASSYYEKDKSDPTNLVAPGSPVPLDDLERFVARNYPIINTQILAMDPRNAPKDSPRYNLHLGVAITITRALTEAHDGKSAETAIPVLTVSEEYFLARFLHVEVTGQSLVSKDGRSYDILHGTDEAGEKVALWFDISAFFP